MRPLLLIGLVALAIIAGAAGFGLARLAEDEPSEPTHFDRIERTVQQLDHDGLFIDRE